MREREVPSGEWVRDSDCPSLMFPRAAHLGTDGGFGNPKLMGPLPDAIINYNSPPPVLRTTRTAKTKLFYFPQIYNQAISGGLLLGHVTLGTGTGGMPPLFSAKKRASLPNNPDPFPPERSRVSARAAWVCLGFTFEKLQGHLTKL